MMIKQDKEIAMLAVGIGNFKALNQILPFISCCLIFGVLQLEQVIIKPSYRENRILQVQCFSQCVLQNSYPL